MVPGMVAAQPAEGIFKHHEHGDSKWFTVTCSCGNAGDSIELSVEADDDGVSVYHYATASSDWWEADVFPGKFRVVKDLLYRLTRAWQILRHGEVKYEVCTIMTAQQALNYSATLEQAVVDCLALRAGREAAAQARAQGAKT